MYYELNVGDKTYKLRLNTRNMVSLEQRIGMNPLAIFGTDGATMRIPTTYEMVSILWASAQQLEHGISLDAAYDIFDAYVASGKTPMEFIEVITGIYKVSGLINSTDEASEEAAEPEKN